MRETVILYWPNKTDNADYQLARKTINTITGAMPDVVLEDIDISGIMQKNPDAVIYYPVFCNSTGWWGELLGADAIVSDKVIISPECQLMVIVSKDNITEDSKKKHLLAAEIHPTSGFFKKMDSSVATISDMLATDVGTILALFTGNNQSKFIKVLENTGNLYLGCIGQL